MGGNGWIKKEVENELLDAFVDSHTLITGRGLTDIESSESPDFLAVMEGRLVGVEVSELRLADDEDAYGYVEEAWRIADKKNTSYKRHNRFSIPIILVLFAQRPPLYELQDEIADMVLEDFDTLEFEEVWFADLSDEYLSVRDPRRPADLFGVSPATYRGFHRYGNWGRKPYG